MRITPDWLSTRSKLFNFPRITSDHIPFIILKYLKNKQDWLKAYAIYNYYLTPTLTSSLESYSSSEKHSSGISWLFETNCYRNVTHFLPTQQEIVKEILSKTVYSLFCDGGFQSGYRSAWAFYVENTNTLYSGSTQHVKTSLQAEFYALNKVLDWIQQQPKNYYLVFTDSLTYVDRINFGLHLYYSQNKEALEKVYQYEPEFLEFLLKLISLPVEINWVSNKHEILSLVDTECDLLLRKKRKRGRKK